MLAAGSSAALVPAWLAFPVAAFLVVTIAIHLQSLKGAQMPESRRRIRSANGWVMLIATPVSAYAFGAATTQDPRAYVMVWLAVAGLLAIVMLLALLDMLNNRRLHRAEVRESRGEFSTASARTVPSTDDAARRSGGGGFTKDGGRDGG